MLSYALVHCDRRGNRNIDAAYSTIVRNCYSNAFTRVRIPVSQSCRFVADNNSTFSWERKIPQFLTFRRIEKDQSIPLMRQIDLTEANILEKLKWHTTKSTLGCSGVENRVSHHYHFGRPECIRRAKDFSDIVVTGQMVKHYSKFMASGRSQFRSFEPLSEGGLCTLPKLSFHSRVLTGDLRTTKLNVFFENEHIFVLASLLLNLYDRYWVHRDGPALPGERPVYPWQLTFYRQC